MDLSFTGERLLPQEGMYEGDLDVPDQYQPYYTPTERTEDWHSRLCDERFRWTSGRRFMTLSNGLIGIGPAASEKGDVVCVLFGASIPFVLRLIGGSLGSSKYKLVGER